MLSSKKYFCVLTITLIRESKLKFKIGETRFYRRLERFFVKLKLRRICNSRHYETNGLIASFWKICVRQITRDRKWSKIARKILPRRSFISFPSFVGWLDSSVSGPLASPWNPLEIEKEKAMMAAIKDRAGQFVRQVIPVKRETLHRMYRQQKFLFVGRRHRFRRGRRIQESRAKKRESKGSRRKLAGGSVYVYIKAGVLRRGRASSSRGQLKLRYFGGYYHLLRGAVNDNKTFDNVEKVSFHRSAILLLANQVTAIDNTRFAWFCAKFGRAGRFAHMLYIAE